MHISCPHCDAAYEVGPLIKNAILVCHRCHTEFNIDDAHSKQQSAAETDSMEMPLPLFEHTGTRKKDGEKKGERSSKQASKKIKKDEHHTHASKSPIPVFLEKDQYTDISQDKKMSAKPDLANANNNAHSVDSVETTETDNIEQHDPKAAFKASEENTRHKTAKEADTKVSPKELEKVFPPARKNVVIWPWLIVILLTISGAGFWYKQDVWLDHPWLRSVLINMHLPVEVRDKDWLIIPGSVQGHWLKRDDGSQVFTIQGRIENRLYCELPPPQILIQFFDNTGLTESLEEKIFSITEPPSMAQIKHAPFVIPKPDLLPIEAQGQRGFFLVLESLPERTADFTLTPSVKTSANK